MFAPLNPQFPTFNFLVDPQKRHNTNANIHIAVQRALILSLFALPPPSLPHLYGNDEPAEVHPVTDLKVGLLLVLGRLLFRESDQLREQSLAILPPTLRQAEHGKAQGAKRYGAQARCV